MKTILLSLHQEWWDKMLTGEKDIEVRKTKPQDIFQDYRVIVYITGGVGIVGEFMSNHFWPIRMLPSLQKTIGADKRDLASHSCLTWKQLYEYAGNSGKRLWGWQVSDVKAYDKPKSLSEFGLKRPPQSWMYLKDFM